MMMPRRRMRKHTRQSTLPRLETLMLLHHHTFLWRLFKPWPLGHARCLLMMCLRRTWIMIVLMIVWSSMYFGSVLVLFSSALFIYLWVLACNILVLGYHLLNLLCFPYLVDEVLCDHTYHPLELFWYMFAYLWIHLYLLWLFCLYHSLPILRYSVTNDLLGFLILLRVSTLLLVIEWVDNGLSLTGIWEGLTPKSDGTILGRTLRNLTAISSVFKKQKKKFLTCLILGSFVREDLISLLTLLQLAVQGVSSPFGMAVF